MSSPRCAEIVWTPPTGWPSRTRRVNVSASGAEVVAADVVAVAVWVGAGVVAVDAVFSSSAGCRATKARIAATSPTATMAMRFPALTASGG